MSRWRAIVLAGVLASAASLSSAETQPDPRIQVVAEPAVIPDFELTDQDGRPFKFSSLRGREALVFFGFTHCSSVCPTTLFEMKQVVASLEKAGGAAPTPVFISVDGERDTPEVMKKYLASFGDSFVGLTGDPKAMRRIAAEFKAVFFKGLPSDAAGNYQIEHTSMTYLVDGEGRLRAYFQGAPVEAIAESIRQLRPDPA